MPLTPEQWSLVDELFHSAGALDPSRREAFVEARTRDAPLVRDTVNRLLAHDAQEFTALDDGIGSTVAELLSPAGPRGLPTGTFGPYRAVEVLGEGGMGIVYLAERPDVGARAALKVLWDAPLSPERRVRFEEEQRILARLRHPGIVPLYDAGETPDGTPWFAMEHVEGTSLSEFCRRGKLSIPERLRLFRDVCTAVRAAHERFVVHGDLKPSNILVTADGRVRLLDFGVATTLDAHSTDDGFRHRLLTPAYASPERRSGDPPTIRTDIFALGVVLFELLADRTPMRIPEVFERPSAASPLRNSAAGRREDWDDLDVLCGAALAPDPVRRYPSVEALIGDVDRYLTNVPLSASAPTSAYKARKFVRRRGRELLVATALVAAASAAIYLHNRSLTASRDAALAEAARTTRLKQFLENLFEGGDQAPESIDSIRVATIVDNGVREARALTTDSATQVDLLESLGIVSERMGQYPRADTLLNEAIAHSTALYGVDAPRTLRARVRLARVLDLLGQHDSAQLALRAAVHAAQSYAGDANPVAAEADVAMGVMLRAAGRPDEALPFLERGLREREKVDTMSREYVEALRELGIAVAASDPMRGDSLARRALPIARRVLGPNHPEVAYLLSNLSTLASERGDSATVERDQREAVAIARAWFGPESYLAAAPTVILAQTLIRNGKAAEAQPLLEYALDIFLRTKEFGPNSPETAKTISTLGNALSKQGQHAAARREFQRALPILQRTLGADDQSSLYTAASLADDFAADGRPDSAITLLTAIVARSVAARGAKHVVTARLQLRLGDAYYRAGRHADAIAATQPAIEVLDSLLGGRRGLTRTARAHLEESYRATGDTAGAERVRRELASMKTSGD